jgi:hypothetical protein
VIERPNLISCEYAVEVLRKIFQPSEIEEKVDELLQETTALRETVSQLRKSSSGRGSLLSKRFLDSNPATGQQSVCRKWTLCERCRRAPVNHRLAIQLKVSNRLPKKTIVSCCRYKLNELEQRPTTIPTKDGGKRLTGDELKDYLEKG